MPERGGVARRWLPLSPAQRMVWMDLRLGADPLAYQLAVRCRIDGALDEATLRQSLKLLAARHDALRLRIDADEPRQWLAEAPEVPLAIEEVQEAALEPRVAALLEAPLPWTDAPLMQVDLLRVGPRRGELVWRVNHLLVDLAGLQLAMQHWIATHNALLDENPGALPPASSFVETLTADAAHAATPAAEADLAHWVQRFAQVPEPVFERRATPAPAAEPLRWALDGKDHERWRAACTQAGVTDQRLLLALLAIAIGTRQDRRDFTIALALHGRDARSRGIVGMLAGALPVRCRWPVDATMRQVVQRLSAQLDEDYRHQRTPVADISRALGLATRGLTKLFDISLSYVQTDDAGAALRLGGATLTPLAVPTHAIVPLPLLVTQRPRSLEFELTVDASYLSAAEAASIADALRRTIVQFCARPSMPVAELEPASDAERAWLLNEFNRPPVPFDDRATLHERVRAQVQATPDAPAVIDGDTQLSYAELDVRSDALARRLHAALPAGAVEPVVAVALPRSAATVVALLAILKARAVYLPLDIAYPAQRLQYLLDDAQAALLIDEPGGITAALNAPRLTVDATESPLPPDTGAERAQRLAYVIYTSGSTGQPKPVGVSHRAAVNLAQARLAHDPIGPGSRVLAAISVGFDVSIGQLLLPLLSGATIVVAPPLRHLDAAGFWSLLARHGVTHINSVPSFFDAVSEALQGLPEAERYRGLQRLMLGGEALTGALARKLQQRLPGAQIVNMYGPTEACIDATAFVVPAEGELPAALPIGRPLPNYRAHVLDRLGRLLPPGVAGELYLAGPGLARGYLRRPGATAEKFVPDPYAAHPGERLYRTGDRARWSEAGQLEFLGRHDQQVKIRGFRVETGEVEAALLGHPAIQQAAVTAPKDAAGHARLVAYLVPAANSPLPDADMLKAWLAERLPDHMVPAALIGLPALPLTANGKLDLRALPAPDAQALGRREFVPPQGETETALAVIWTELLHQPRIGRHDSFFDLGGHSLLAIALVDRMRRQGLVVDVTALFAQPTLEALARAVRRDGGEAGATGAVPPRGIPDGATRLTPDMLPMLALTQAQLDALAGPTDAANVQDVYPLAPLQQGLLFHHLLQGEGDPYLTPMVLAFATRAELDAFIGALRQVVARHDVLRTSFAWKGLPQPVQVVWRTVDLVLEEQHPAGDALGSLQAQLDARHHRLELTRAPLLRALCVKDESCGRWLLGLALHHLTLDHVSVGLVMQEVAAILRGDAATLPPPVPYRDSVWQAIEAPAGEAEAFFRARLADVDAPTAPYGLTDVRAGAAEVHDARHALPDALALAARSAAREAGVTVASLLHLAWALVVARTSGRDDVVFGTVLFGRMKPAARDAMGLFINTLPLRVNAGAPSVADALRRTHAEVLELLKHEHAPLTLAQRCSGVAAPAPLFTALFNYRMQAAAPASTAELLWSQQLTGYPVALAVDDDGAAFGLHVQSLAPADPARVARLMARAVERVVQALQTAPATRCDALDLIDTDERALLLKHFNPPPLAVPRERTLHELVREQVARSPDALAVIDGEVRLSYRELDARSEVLARRLRAALPLGEEPVVGVALPRSAGTVVALLAILKAQAVYLPLDIAYPLPRLQYLLDDAGAVLLIDEPEGPTAALKAPRLAVDAPEAALPSETAADRAARLAYVIYTSGSTGQPKPVGVSHGAAVHLAWARQHGHDPIGEGSRVLAAISVGFDVSIGQLLLPLLHGAAIVVAPPLRTLQASDFWALLREQQVTHINSVPSFFETVGDALPPEGHRGLVRLMLGGEALTAATVRKLQQRLPGTQIVNMYGPTEACIDATAFVVPAEGELPTAIPIGRPLANYRVVVLDERGRLVPLGVTGELCIGGAGLARGYLNRPDATAEKFIADPYADTPGARLYRTGDLARWTADGQLEFLGRNDEQVKVRGFRVETGEIEATLLQHPSIRQVAVIARKGRAGHVQLLGHLVARDQPIDTKTIRAWLAERLPDHMVPAALGWLDTLPLTPNGKLDRKALPDLGGGLDAAAEPPEGETERAVAAAWQAVLGVDAVHRDDDFFALGGQSLMAIALVERLRQAGLQLDVPTLFSQPTLRAMAAACRAEGGATPARPVPARGIPEGAARIVSEMLPMVSLSQAQIDSLVAAVPGGAAQVQDVYPLAPLQQGMLYHHLMQPAGDVYLTPLIAAFPQQQAMDGYLEALQRVIARHDILRTSIAWAGLAEPVQVVWREAPLAIERLDAVAGADALETLKSAVDARVHRLDLTRAPLLRAVTMHDAPNGRWLLALCLHHLVLDHTSMEIVMQEVAALQQGAPLPPAVPFRDLVWYAHQGVAEEEHRTFFTEMLGDVDMPTTPYGLAAVQGNAEGIREAHLVLPDDLAAAARQAARTAGSSAASLMHLAWALVLARTSGRDDVVFGTVLFGRMNAAAGAARALGMLINTLPLRVGLGEAGVGAALAATHQRLVGLMRHEHAPLALAQRCSGVAAPAPLFTALFNHRHAAPASRTAPGFDLVWGEERTGYPLSMAVDDDGTGFAFTVQSLAPADPARVARLMARAVERVVQALQTAPATRCDALDLIDTDERALLLKHFNPPPLAVPRERTLHELVREQVARSPDALAVIDGEVRLSYRELDARSEVLARRLRAALPAGEEPVVGVALPRSAGTVVALLAILKAQAAYLPLDIAYPLPRLQYLLDDAGAVLLIDEPEGPTAALKAPRLAVDAPEAALPSETAADRAARLAYVIYTSGSTGQPKPVGVSHGAAIHLAWARQHGHDPIGEGSRVLAAISVGFDVSIGQLLLPLLHGAAIVVAPPLRTLQASDFWALLREQQVTHINSVPSFFETVGDALPPEGHRGLVRLMLGGEALTAATVRKLQQRLPGTQIVNMYGPTEACIDATAFVVPAEGELPTAIPIGRPLANYRVVVLDERGRLVPLGVTGELCIGGAGLARGYLNRPDATAEKFIADPYADTPGARLYRTGDLARWTADGQLEFLGRNDEQVKVRGFRVETGEIEATLLQHPSIRQVAVIARKGRAGHVQLLGHLVARDQPIDTKTIRAWLAERLPDHMVPAALGWLHTLPLTPNGKLDRQALPDIDTAGASYTPPRNAREHALQVAWQTVLAHAPIGIDDDFFSLGGHSLLALRLVHACQSALRERGDAAAAERLSLRQLLAQPTIAGMAHAIDAPALPPHRGLLVPLRGGSAAPVFCVHPQSGTVWCFAELARQLRSGVPVYGLQAQGLDEGEAPLQTVGAMAEVAIAALREVQPQGPYRLVGYSSGGVTAFEMARQLRAAGETVSSLVLLDSPVPDGSDAREPTEAETLADAGRLLGAVDPAQWPRNAAELAQQMRGAGLADAAFDAVAAQRLVDTALGIVRATRRYRAAPDDHPLVQVRALHRDTPPSDWRSVVPAAAVTTYDLPTDHVGLVGPAWAARVAAIIDAHLP